jgi:hypothetical protein
MDLEIRVDEKRLREIQRMLADIPKALPKVMSRAINKTATSVRAKMVRDISSKIALKQKEIREDISIRKATYSRWQASVNLSRHRHGLIRFGARQTRTGVSYRIDKARGRKTIPHAFIATMNNAENVWVRVKGDDGKLVGRFPVRRLKGISIGEAWRRSAPMVMSGYAHAQETLEKNIDSQIKLLLARAQENVVARAADVIGRLSEIAEAA